jgi:hypothetical protein
MNLFLYCPRHFRVGRFETILQAQECRDEIRMSLSRIKGITRTLVSANNH